MLFSFSYEFVRFLENSYILLDEIQLFSMEKILVLSAYSLNIKLFFVPIEIFELILV